MTAKIVRLCDFDHRSKQPDAVRNPCDAEVIVLPVVRIERFHDLEMSKDNFPAMPWRQ